MARTWTPSFYRRRALAKCGRAAITAFAMIGALVRSLILGAHNRQRGYRASADGLTAASSVHSFN